MDIWRFFSGHTPSSLFKSSHQQFKRQQYLGNWITKRRPSLGWKGPSESFIIQNDSKRIVERWLDWDWMEFEARLVTWSDGNDVLMRREVVLNRLLKTKRQLSTTTTTVSIRIQNLDTYPGHPPKAYNILRTERWNILSAYPQQIFRNQLTHLLLT